LLSHGQVSTLDSSLITEHLLIKLREVFSQGHIQVFQDVLDLLLQGILNFSWFGNQEMIFHGFLWGETYLANEFGRAVVAAVKAFSFSILLNKSWSRSWNFVSL
jgi:hypothetical protein